LTVKACSTGHIDLDVFYGVAFRSALQCRSLKWATFMPTPAIGCYLLITLVVSENTLSTALEISGVAAAINNEIKTSMMAYSIVVTPHSFCLFVNISLPSFLQMSIGANRSRTSSSPVNPLPKQADDSVNGRRRTIRRQVLHEPADRFIQLCPRFWIADQTEVKLLFLKGTVRSTLHHSGPFQTAAFWPIVCCPRTCFA